MRVGVAVFTTAEFSMDDVVQRLDDIERLGVGHAELRFGDVPLAREGSRFNPQALTELQDILSSYSLTLSAHAAIYQDGFRLNPADPSASVRRRSLELLRLYLDTCERLDASPLITHLGKVFPDGRDDEWLEGGEAVAEAKRTVPALAHDSSIPLVIENSNVDPVRVAVFERPEEVVDFEFPVCLDIGHGWTSSSYHGFEPEEFVRLLKNRIVHLHIHDNLGRVHPEGESNPEEGWGDIHLPIGKGTCPVERFLEGLQGFRGTVVLEHDPFVPEDVPPVVRRIRKLLEV
ncbi:MAG: sugar phosphate isomerase/epimerase [Methanopyri archaeon]|jgi:sugar phosphate isomerase/epimerase|nr:sugar phosphate isomerase/epimerase [Methanopyri archaeon]